jgi:DNA-binding XRE family transcriptional regulator
LTEQLLSERNTLKIKKIINDMTTKEMRKTTLSEMKDRYIGQEGTPERDSYEYELKMEVLGKMIKSARKERNMTQEQLGKLIGVQKSQISKLESSANSATIDTIMKVFKALKAEINFHVKLEDDFVKLA